MASKAQKRAIEKYRSRLARRGIVRFELQACEGDRDLIRMLARKLIEEGSEAGHLRRTMQRAVSSKPAKRGGIVTALRRSPLVDAALDLARPREEGRVIDL